MLLKDIEYFRCLGIIFFPAEYIFCFCGILILIIRCKELIKNAYVPLLVGHVIWSSSYIDRINDILQKDLFECQIKENCENNCSKGLIKCFPLFCIAIWFFSKVSMYYNERSINP